MEVTGNLGESPATNFRLHLRCPTCLKMGVFEGVNAHDQTFQSPKVGLANNLHNCLAGFRRCPDRECQEHVFFLAVDGEVRETHPPERVDFDPSDIPDPIVATFSEALTCYAHRSYIAAAIMVRRTMEEICEEQGAKGKDLKARIEDLRSKIVLPKELLDAADELRIFGNDATHIEAKEYGKINQPKCLLAIDLTKQILMVACTRFG
jgi:hypothetical protein